MSTLRAGAWNGIGIGRFIRLAALGCIWVLLVLKTNSEVLGTPWSPILAAIALIATPIVVYNLTGAGKIFSGLEWKWFIFFGILTLAGVMFSLLVWQFSLLGTATHGMDLRYLLYLFAAGGLAGATVGKLACGMIPHAWWSSERNAELDPLR